MNAVGTDDTPRTDPAAVTALVDAHSPLVDHLVREAVHRLPSAVPAEPLIRVATVALRAAARAFDPASGVPFGAGARTAIQAALTEDLGRTRWAPTGRRSDASAGRSGDEHQGLVGAIAALPRQLRIAVTAYYYDQRGADEIAAELGVTTARVAQLQVEALRRLHAIRQAAAAARHLELAQRRGA